MCRECFIQKNKFVIDTELKDGLYVIVPNNQDYFLLFEKCKFDEFVEKIRELPSKDEKRLNSYLRSVFVHAREIVIKDNSFIISKEMRPYITLQKYQIEENEYFIRICRDIEFKCINDCYYDMFVKSLIESKQNSIEE